MDTLKMTMAQALVRFLNQQYLDVDGEQTPLFAGVMTIFGHGNVLGIGQALEQDAGHLQVHQGCNEQGMAHIAVGFAKQHRRRRVYAVTTSVGPGSANLVTAAATATANRIPLLLLPGICSPAVSPTRCCSKSSSITTRPSAPTIACGRCRATGTASVVRSN
ncbi:3D-(3,5/4)-trihydroxycyclohexane-1,2-dione hydrolase [Dickeya solani]|nr:3D-(3,5/4)-trihydroxycyclohexane-1,2-dione hydrolase [Dickeya solani]